MSSPFAPRQKVQHATAAKAAGQDLYKFLLSTGRVDRDGDTVDPLGWDLTNYKKNPVVLYAHRHDILPIGQPVDIGVDRDGLQATMKFPPAGVNRLADSVRGMVDAGMLVTTSVGFKPIKWTPARERQGNNYHQQELLEWSIVPVPSNVDATIRRGRGDDLIILDDDPVPLPDAPREIQRLLTRSRALGQVQRRLLDRGVRRAPAATPRRPTTAENAHIHIVAGDDGQIYTYDDRSIDLRTAPAAVKRALVAEVLEAHGAEIRQQALTDAVREVAHPLLLRMTGNLDFADIGVMPPRRSRR